MEREQRRAMEIITSSANQKVKILRLLSQKAGREKCGLFLLEGARLVEDALLSGAPLDTVFVSESAYLGGKFSSLLEEIEKKDLTVTALADKLFNSVSETQHSQGLLAAAPIPKEEAADFSKPGGLYLLLDGVQDPGNLGTLLRTADAAGMDGVFLLKGTADVYNPKVVRASMGALFHVKVMSVSDGEGFLKALRQKGISLVAGDLSGEASYDEADLRGSLMIAVGNEGNGISDLVRREADKLVRIDMPGRAESLNAAIAAGVLIFEALRQRKKSKHRIDFEGER